MPQIDSKPHDGRHRWEVSSVIDTLSSIVDNPSKQDVSQQSEFLSTRQSFALPPRPSGWTPTMNQSNAAPPSLMEQTWSLSGDVRGIYRSHIMSVEELELSVVGGPHQGASISFEREYLTIGRESWCDLALPLDRRLSRSHCELRYTPRGVILRDLGSRNGIYVQEIRVFEALLQANQSFKVGDTQIQLTPRKRQAEIQIPYFDDSGRLIGESQAMRSIFSMLSRLKTSDVPVLLQGETGTGKSNIAQAIHEQSPRSQQPFVVVNCGALAPSLVEAELFGYEKGAFSGAHKAHRGTIEQAHGGTLFLDEIGELPLAMQTKLLDVLERKKVRRLGSEMERDIDFRLLTATHRDLKQSVKLREFREDLYYRLAVVEIEIPPLRERVEDISLLAMHFLLQLKPDRNLRPSPSALHLLEGYLWPGNVRQLRNVIQRSLVFLRGDILDASHLVLPTEGPGLDEPSLHPTHSSNPSAPPHPSQAAPYMDEQRSFKERVALFEKEILLKTLERCHWRIKKAVQELGVSRGWLYRLMSRHNIERPE